jgi:hypothetical protein
MALTVAFSSAPPRITPPSGTGILFLFPVPTLLSMSPTISWPSCLRHLPCLSGDKIILIMIVDEMALACT